MAIDPIASRLQNTPATKSPVKSGNESNAKSIKSEFGGDRIEITANSDQIKKALESAGETPVIDRARVEAIKQALANGAYVIDPERIAQKMSQFADLLTPEDSP